jgi:hypothetical protein
VSVFGHVTCALNVLFNFCNIHFISILKPCIYNPCEVEEQVYGTWNPLGSNQKDGHGIVTVIGDKTAIMSVSKEAAHSDFPTLINLFSKLFKIEGRSSSSEALEALDMVVNGEGRMKTNVMRSGHVNPVN